MSTEKRRVTLYCPICGNVQFSCLDMEIDSLIDAPDDTRIQCADCKGVFTKAELIEANQDVINANIEDMTQKYIKEFEMKLKKMFK